MGYPNADDRRRAQADGRTQLGGDIMIHGSNASIGCLAMGDPASEELFVLAALVGPQNVRVILSPVDFRRQDTVTLPAGQPAWVPALHAQIMWNRLIAVVEEQAQTYEAPEQVVKWYYQSPDRLREIESMAVEIGRAHV